MSQALRRWIVFAVGLALANCATGMKPDAAKGAIAFRYRRVDGEIDTLGRHRGKVVIVSIFATWAQPALLDVPLYQSLLHQFENEDLVIMQIAIDREPQAVEVYVETFDIHHLVGRPIDPDAFTSASGPLGVIGILPTSVLIDREGQIALKSEGTWNPRVLTPAVQRLLAADRPSH